MDWGAVSQISADGDEVVGAEWTRQAGTLLLTTKPRVSLRQAPSGRLVASWLTRPGASTAFSVPAIQDPRTGRIVCVQAGSRLMSWADSASDLGDSKSTRLKKAVFALRTCRTANGVVVVFEDGSVALHDPSELHPIAACRPSKMVGKTVAAWNVTLSPAGASTESAVLVLVDAGSGKAGGRGAGGRGGKGTRSYSVLVYLVKPGSSGSTADIELTCSHLLPQPSSAAGATDQIADAAFHPSTRSLSIVWHSGIVQTLAFRGSSRWYGSSPVVTRSSMQEEVGSASRCGPIGRGGLFVSQLCERAAMPPTAKGKRTKVRKDLVDLQLLAWDSQFGVEVSRKVVSSSSEVPSVLHMAVSRDGRNLAVVGTDGLTVLPVSFSAGSLASVLGSLEGSMSTPDGGGPALGAVVDIDACVSAYTTAMESAERLSSATTTKGGRRRRSSSVASVSDVQQAAASPSAAWKATAVELEAAENTALSLLRDRKQTPDAASFNAVFVAFMNGADVDTIEKAAASGQKPTKGKPRRKRSRTLSMDASEANAPRTPSEHFVRVVVDRCLDDVELGLWKALRRLLRTRCVSSASNKRLLKVLMAEEQFELLEDCLRCVPDVSEADLVNTLRCIMRDAKEETLATFVRLKFAKKQYAKRVPTDPSELSAVAVEHFMCQVLRAPRNDVAMERALRVLSSSEVALLLTGLIKLLEKYSSTFLDVPMSTRSVLAKDDGGSGTWLGATPKTHLPTLSQIIDWSRLVIDAHFSHVVLLSSGKSSLNALIARLQGLVQQQVKLCERVGPLRGQLAHVLDKEPLPVALVPSYSIDVLDL